MSTSVGSEGSPRWRCLGAVVAASLVTLLMGLALGGGRPEGRLLVVLGVAGAVGLSASLAWIAGLRKGASGADLGTMEDRFSQSRDDP